MISKSICGNTIISTSQSRTGDKKNSRAQRFWCPIIIKVSGVRCQVKALSVPAKS
jgi:hypothetical protein